MFDPNNDADMLTLDMQGAAQDAENGVCSLCDEALDPFAPQWANDYNERYTAQGVWDCYGPKHPDLPYHASCLEDDR
jgi:hypothetical protein